MIGTSLYHTKTISAEYSKSVLGFSLFALFSVLFSVIYLEHYMAALQKNTDQETALRLKQQQCEIYENQIEDNRQIRSLYHNMKNHLLVLEHSRPEEFKEYLAEFKERLDKYHMEFQTGNPWLDILLRDKSRICAGAGIALDVNVNFLDVDILKPIEVCIVCGNLLDNALEANMQIADTDRRFVEMTAHRQKSNFVIKISNACQKEPVRIGEKFLSSKSDKRQHGLGIENVKQVVSEKHGLYTAKAENGVYSVYVIFPL